MPVPYVILCNENQFVCPIKALNSPYPRGGRAYLGGQPNFFGGAQNRGESTFAALRREVDEESARTCALTSYVNQAAFRGQFLRGAVMVEANFYYSVGWNHMRPWPDARELGRLAAQYREMCCVVGISRDDFSFLRDREDDDAIILSLTDIYDTIYRVARLQAPPAAVAQMIDSPTQEYRDSETAKAFVAFVNKWLTRSLPGWPGRYPGLRPLAEIWLDRNNPPVRDISTGVLNRRTSP